MRYIFMMFPKFKSKAVTLSYDDNCIYDKRLVEIMAENGLKGTFNVNSSMLYDETKYRKLTKSEAKKLYIENGMEVAVHGKEHLSLTELSSVAKVKEIYEDKKKLEEVFQCIVQGMAYANGVFDDESAHVLNLCGIRYARTTMETEDFSLPCEWLKWHPTCHHNHPELMNLAKRFIEEGKNEYFWDKSNAPRLFYLWGHSYQFNDENNWHVIEDFAKYIGGRNDVFYATNGEIYQYVQAYNRLEQSVDGNYIYNPSAITVYLNCYGRQVAVEGGKTVKIEI